MRVHHAYGYIRLRTNCGANTFSRARGRGRYACARPLCSLLYLYTRRAAIGPVRPCMRVCRGGDVWLARGRRKWSVNSYTRGTWIIGGCMYTLRHDPGTYWDFTFFPVCRGGGCRGEILFRGRTREFFCFFVFTRGGREIASKSCNYYGTNRVTKFSRGYIGRYDKFLYYMDCIVPDFLFCF